MGSADTETEVRKLQALVKELESQNKELRTERQLFMLKGSVKDKVKGDYLGHSNVMETCASNQIVPQSLEAFDLLEIENTKCNDEETWLIESPNTKPHSKEWLRKDVDDPSLNIAKKSLISKLDQISVSPHSSPHRGLLPSPGRTSPSRDAVSPMSPCSGDFDSRTFIRQKKKSYVLYNDENKNSLLKKGGSRDNLLRSNGSLGSEDDDRLSSASEGSFSYPLADVDEVTAVAKLQEESLRMPLPHRMSRKSEGSMGSITSSQEDLLDASPSQNSRFIAELGLRLPSRRLSNVTSPQEVLYKNGVQSTLNGRRGGTFRIPSSSGGMNCRLGGSDPRLLDDDPPPMTKIDRFASQSELRQESTSPARLSRLQTPQKPQSRSRLSAPSPVRIPMPVGSSIPQPKTMIPRPGSRLQPPKSRSELTKPGMQLANQGDWRDECF